MLFYEFGKTLLDVLTEGRVNVLQILLPALCSVAAENMKEIKSYNNTGISPIWRNIGGNIVWRFLFCAVTSISVTERACMLAAK